MTPSELPRPTPYDPLFATGTLYGEVRGVSELAITGVAWVIVHRCQLRRQTVPEVVLAPAQFSCWTEQRWQRLMLAWLTDAAAWERLSDVWSAVVCGARIDPTNGATHFVSDRARPAWFDENKVLARIDTLEFLRVA